MMEIRFAFVITQANLRKAFTLDYLIFIYTAMYRSLLLCNKINSLLS